jgi:hypothetical protein
MLFDGDRCVQCGGSPAPTVLTSVGALCDPCWNAFMCHGKGRDPLPPPPPPETFTGPDGSRHVMGYTLRHGATGIEAGLREIGPDEGYELISLAHPDADPQDVIEHVRQAARREIGRRYLKPGPYGGTTMDRDHVQGRIIWSASTGPEVVVDGRRMSWAELGQAIGNEGCRFTITLDDRIDLVDGYDPVEVFGPFGTAG